MLTQPRIQDSFFRSNVFHRWVQPKSHRTAACQECAHPPRIWTPVILLGNQGLSEIRPSPGPSVPVCHSATFYFWLPSFKKQLRNIFPLCPIWMVWLPWSMCLFLLPSLLTVLRTEKVTNLSYNKPRWCQGLNAVSQGESYCLPSAWVRYQHAEPPALLGQPWATTLDNVKYGVIWFWGIFSVDPR